MALPGAVVKRRRPRGPGCLVQADWEPGRHLLSLQVPPGGCGEPCRVTWCSCLLAPLSERIITALSRLQPFFMGLRCSLKHVCLSVFKTQRYRSPPAQVALRLAPCRLTCGGHHCCTAKGFLWLLKEDVAENRDVWHHVAFLLYVQFMLKRRAVNCSGPGSQSVCQGTLEHGSKFLFFFFYFYWGIVDLQYCVNICIYIFRFFKVIFPYRSLQSIELRSLCYRTSSY